MQWYKRSPWELVKWCLYAPLLGLLVYFGTSLFTTGFWIKCAAGAVCGLGLLLFTLFFDNVKLCLDENGTLTHYKAGHLKNSILLAGCKTDYRHTPERVFFTSPDIILDITVPAAEAGQPAVIKIDCSALGLARFRRLFAAIREATGEGPKPSAMMAHRHTGRRKKAPAMPAVQTGDAARGNASAEAGPKTACLPETLSHRPAENSPAPGPSARPVQPFAEPGSTNSPVAAHREQPPALPTPSAEPAPIPAGQGRLIAAQPEPDILAPTEPMPQTESNEHTPIGPFASANQA